MTSAPAYRSLVAWQRADELFVRLHRLVKTAFPADEQFVLGSQLRRAALSVPANIVEGTARYHGRERVQFLRIAWSSLAEAGYYVHVAHRLEYLGETTRLELESEIRQVAAPLLGLIRQQESRRR
jgi:four helix bundle protein